MMRKTIVAGAGLKYKFALAVCARWESAYIVEWLSYHQLLGFDHVFLYCNDDTPEEMYGLVLPFLRGQRPFVTFRHHPVQGEQYQMYLHFLRNHLDECEWFGFLDVDEFIRVPPGQSIGDFVGGFGESLDCLLFNWVVFGASGHPTPPPGNVLENYTKREDGIHPYTKYVARSSIFLKDWIDGPKQPKAFWHAPEDKVVAGARLRNVLGEEARDYYVGFPERAKAFVNEPARQARILATAAIHHYSFRSERAYYERAERGLGGDFAGQKMWRELTASPDFAGYLRGTNAIVDASLAGFWPAVRQRARVAGREAESPPPRREDRPGTVTVPASLRAGAPLAVRGAVEITERVPAAAFRAARHAHAAIHGATMVPINRPRFINTSSSVKIAGPVYLLPDVGRIPDRFPERISAPELTLTRLENVICLPGQIALHISNSGGAPELLLESLANQWERQAVYLDKINDHAFALREDVHEAVSLPGRYLYLDNMHSPHFGHFLLDVLSKMWAWDAARALGIDDLQVLVERHEAAHIVPLLEACGVPRRAMHRVTAPVRCAEMLFATRSFLVQSYTTPVAMATYSRVRDALDEGAGPEKVYVSRSRVGNRQLRNEAEVEDIFRRRGFLIAHPQELTIGQQVTMWANARYVAGTNGSNMFGLAFQRQLRRALIVNSPNLLHFQEMFMQAGATSETSFYIGESLGGEVHDAWQINAADLARHVDAWLAEADLPLHEAGQRQRPAARHKAAYLGLFDEAFYLDVYEDVREMVTAGRFPNGLHHYEALGFDEGRKGFAFDEIWYAATFPEVLNEVAHGNFLDCQHHYAAIGHLVGCPPCRPHVPASEEVAGNAAPASTGPVNLARGRPATQSSRSQWSRGATLADDAAGAVDGAPDGERKFHTALEANPWWQVDLGRPMAIGKIVIFNTTHPVARGRFTRFSLSIGLDAESLVEVFRKEDDAPVGGVDSPPFVWQPALSAFARLVRVTLTGTGFLHLAQVEVFGPG